MTIPSHPTGAGLARARVCGGLRRCELKQGERGCKDCQDHPALHEDELHTAGQLRDAATHLGQRYFDPMQCRFDFFHVGFECRDAGFHARIMGAATSARKGTPVHPDYGVLFFASHSSTIDFSIALRFPQLLQYSGIKSENLSPCLATSVENRDIFIRRTLSSVPKSVQRDCPHRSHGACHFAFINRSASS